MLKEITELQQALKEREESIAHLQFQLDKVMSTRRWKIATYLSQIYHSIFDYLRPTLRERSTSRFNPYEYIKLLKDIEINLWSERHDSLKKSVTFSTATTVFNETKDILNFLKSMENQSVQPDEVVLVDGGSTDTTVKTIRKYQKLSKLNIKLIVESKLNIPAGRNMAIRNCSNEIIVLADAGTRLDKDYCKNLLAALESNPGVDLVGGIYLPMEQTEYAKKFIPDWKSIDWKIFLPSTRSMLLKKSLAVQAGLYPEYLQTGDDTLFDVNYRRVSHKWVFNPSAIVYWDCPTDKYTSAKLGEAYGYGQGRNGLGDFSYYPVESGDLSDPFYLGYLRGRNERANLEIEARGIKGLVIVFGELPLHDKAEFLHYNLVQLLMWMKYKVIYVNRYSRVHPDSYKAYLNLDLTMIEFYNYGDFDKSIIMSRYRDIARHIYIFEPRTRIAEIARMMLNNSPLKNYYRPASDCQIPNLSVVYERYLGRKTDGVFVEVGAYDGSSISNTAFLADLGWRGLYVEPVPEYAKMCNQRHKSNNVVIRQVAVGDKESKVSVNVGGDISTTLNNPKEFYTSIGFPDEAKKHTGKRVIVKQVTLETLLTKEKISAKFDLLVIDTEGTEWSILKAFRINKWMPKMVIVEMHEKSVDWNKSDLIRSSNVMINRYFEQAGYKKIYSDDINTIFIR